MTTNGFDDSFLPHKDQFEEKRIDSRKKIVHVASAVLGYKVSEDSFLMATSGRDEYKNKSIDLFIDALADLDNKEDVKRQVIAFILVPNARTIPRPEVVEAIASSNFQEADELSPLTHYLQNPSQDPILQQIKRRGLYNNPGSKVRILKKQKIPKLT